MINFYGLNENCTVLVINSRIQMINSTIQGINSYGLNENCTVLVINSRVQMINSMIQMINSKVQMINSMIQMINSRVQMIKLHDSDDKLQGSAYERYLDYLNRTDSKTFSTKILPTEP